MSITHYVNNNTYKWLYVLGVRPLLYRIKAPGKKMFFKISFLSKFTLLGFLKSPPPLAKKNDVVIN